MGEFFEEIPEKLIAWVLKQHVFWVATAPLTPDGHVNVSPKGVEGSFHVVNSRRVWYEDLTGSGSETIAHVRENRRITILFNAFEGPPRIVRLFGTGTIHEYGTPEYDAYMRPEDRTPGSRSIVVIDVHKVGTSCGYAVPFYEYKAQRTKLVDMSVKMECLDRDTETSGPAPLETAPRPAEGLKWYWAEMNKKSIDGLPAVRDAGYSTKTFPEPGQASLGKFKSGSAKSTRGSAHSSAWSRFGSNDGRFMLALGFSAGFLAAAASMKLMSGL